MTDHDMYCHRMERVLALMRLENDETHGDGVNAPTIIEFFDAYTPLMVNSSNYIHDIARFNIELVIHPIINRLSLENYNPSIIAFAAMMRADDAFWALLPYDGDDDYYDDDEDDENWMSRGDHDGLINELGLDQALVQEAVVVLENAIPNRAVRRCMNWVAQWPGPNAIIHYINQVAPVALGRFRPVRPESPSQVDMFL